ncbi:MFS hexose transporter [Coleophoma crateriformis]|uniref:MFS hexose transporter n=1 Tax=Coleophoma crateriformis TaxID=565419 RepID=A0A3D8QC35_9HELO|nr:MFS hexose transporter [Coleophoma crateriformis]
MEDGNNPVSSNKETVVEIEDSKHVEDLGHLVNQEEHDVNWWQCIKQNPKIVMWCLYSIWFIILASFDNAAGISTISIPEFRKDFGSPFNGDYVLPARWQSAYNGAPTAFTVASSLSAGLIADRFGRKLTFFIAFIVSFIGVTVEMISTTNAVFFVGKSVNGVAIGLIISVGMTYVGEITPPALRGLTTAACALAFTFGPWIGSFIVLGTGTKTNRWAYRAMFASQYGFNVTGFVFLWWLPESPWWLVSKNRKEAALQSLQILGLSVTDAHKKVANIELTLEANRQETDGATYFECFRRSNLRRTIISIAPLSIHAFAGISFLGTYFAYYIQLSGISTENSFRIGVINGIANVIANLVSLLFIDRVGRRNLSLIGMVLIVLLLAAFSACAAVGTPLAAKVSVACVMIWAVVFNVTIGATAYTIVTEIATPRLRVKTIALGLALQNTWNTMWAFVLPFIFNPNEANLGGKTGFIFVGFSFLALVYMFFYQPETAHRTYEEIDELFAKRVPARAFKTYQTEAELKGIEAKGREKTHV